MGPFKALWCSNDQTSNKLAIKKFHGLYRKKLIDINYHIYGSAKYLEEHGYPKNISDLNDLWIEDRSFNPNLKNDSSQIINLWEIRINKLL